MVSPVSAEAHIFHQIPSAIVWKVFNCGNGYIKREAERWKPS
ncbi:hypothetical protein NRS6084_03796 [Bacillus subtilis]|nr:hypothetical protein BSHJ0_00697 [Bacillus subtilis]TWH26425.1 hypothetical protein L609_000500002050 [Bacillus subtilis J22]GIN83393.1 hypothetical protein J5TS4_39710 [Bacillus sp. J5TS4]CAF1761617.1 hypothetical protein NRS6099_03314 [Bacillus subtilis]CAF1768218.1 hypothetical protein NRS6103_03613 [Bacillus subtilis]